MLLMYFMSDFEMVPVAPVISGITLLLLLFTMLRLLEGLFSQCVYP